MKYSFETLVFEITRKCNMKCAHCLRGDAQNKNMSKDIMLKALEDVSYIDCVVFGGGEPTLNLEMIHYFIECCRMLEIEVGNFYIVTNGRVYHRELESVCDELYAFCTDNEISGLTVSDDEFHREWQPNRALFEKTRDRYYYGEEVYRKEIQYYGGFEEMAKPYAAFKDKTHKDGQFYGLINMGRAKENWLGERELRAYPPRVLLYEDTLSIDSSEIYITYNGDYLSSCDVSYEEMPNFKIGNIFEKEKTFLNFLKEEIA